MDAPRTNICLVNADGVTIINDFEDISCLNCILNSHTQGQKSATCPINGLRRHLHYQSDSLGILYICDDKERTSKNFRVLVELILHSRPAVLLRYENMATTIRRDAFKEMDDFKHNIVHINTDAINEFYYFIEQEYLARNYRKMHDKISETVVDKPNQAADLIAHLVKYNLNIKTEISAVSKLNNPDSKPNFSPNNPRDAIMTSVYTLYPLFRKRSVIVNVGEYREKFEIEYDALQVASFYIIENATKYTEKGGKVEIFFERDQRTLQIVFTMKSLFLSNDEASHIFEEGFQGKQAKDTGRGGKGIGLYRAKRLVTFFDGVLTVETGKDASKGKDGFLYATNRFIITLPVRLSIK